MAFPIDEDLRFFREIQYIKNNCAIPKISDKYSTVYLWYKNYTYTLFKQLEDEGFFPSALNPNYVGTINPFDIIAEKEYKKEKS